MAETCYCDGPAHTYWASWCREGKDSLGRKLHPADSAPAVVNEVKELQRQLYKSKRLEIDALNTLANSEKARNKLLSVIRDAPHTEDCMAFSPLGRVQGYTGGCTCWKAAHL